MCFQNLLPPNKRVGIHFSHKYVGAGGGGCPFERTLMDMSNNIANLTSVSSLKLMGASQFRTLNNATFY